MQSGSSLGSVSTHPNAASGKRSDLSPCFGYKYPGDTTNVSFTITDRSGRACATATTY